MKLDLAKFSNANSNIEILTKDINSKQYLMLDIQDDCVKVCYSDGKISYIESVEGEGEEGDSVNKVVVELSGLLQKLGVCKAKAPIQVDPLQLAIVSEDAIEMNCQKYIDKLVVDEDGEYVDDGTGQAKTERVDTNKVNTKLKFHQISDNIRFSMTTKMNYDEIFNGDGWVTCEVSEFKNLLNKLSKTDGARDCYISPKKKSGFSVGTAYTVVLPLNFEGVACSLSVSAVKKLYNVLSKVKAETVNLLAESSQFLKVTSEDKDLGLVFEQSPVVKQQLATLGTFESMDYSTQGLQFYKAVLSDMVDGTVAVSGAEIETALEFMVEGDAVKASTVKKGTGNGIDTFSVTTSKVIGELSQFAGFRVELSFNVLKTILGNCDGEFVEFGFANMEDEKYMRITDITKDGKEDKVLGYYYLCV